MNLNPSFGIIRGKGVLGRVYIEAAAELAGTWLFADEISFRALCARQPRSRAGSKAENNDAKTRAVGNVVVFSGVSADSSWRGIDTKHPGGQTLSRIATLIEVISDFAFPIELPVLQARRRSPQLVEAAKSNDFAAVQSLLESGSEANSVDEKGNSALLYAVSRDSEMLVTLLSAYGADPFHENSNGICALSLARERGRNSLLADLMKAESQCKSVARINAYFPSPS